MWFSYLSQPTFLCKSPFRLFKFPFSFLSTLSQSLVAELFLFGLCSSFIQLAGTDQRHRHPNANSCVLLQQQTHTHPSPREERHTLGCRTRSRSREILPPSDLNPPRTVPRPHRTCLYPAPTVRHLLQPATRSRESLIFKASAPQSKATRTTGKPPSGCPHTHTYARRESTSKRLPPSPTRFPAVLSNLQTTAFLPGRVANRSNTRRTTPRQMICEPSASA